MTRTLTSILVLGSAVALAATSAHATSSAQSRALAPNLPTRPSLRSPLAVVSPSALGANSTTYQDSVGEDPSAPDVTTIVVSNDDAANISFRFEIPNRPQYSADIAVVMFLDSDANQATGDPQSLGADHIIQLIQGEILLFRWDGSDFTQAPSTTLAYAWSNGLTVRINAADLNNTRRVLFDVTAVSGVAFTASGAIDCTNCHRDFAPASGFYAFDVQISSQQPPPPTPPPAKPRTWRDAPKLPKRLYFAGPISIKHVRLGEKLYDTMQQLQREGQIRVPRVVAVACWAKGDWPAVARSAGFKPKGLAGFFMGARQPRWLHIAPKECADVQGLMTDRQPNGHRAFALSTVLHERVHAEGVGVEAAAECFSIQLVYDFARELNFTHAKALRLEQLAVRKSNAVFTGTKYRDPVKCREGGVWDLYPEFSNLTY